MAGIQSTFTAQQMISCEALSSRILLAQLDVHTRI